MVKRCMHESCKKILNLTAFPCKCEKTFCSEHRSHYDHSCSFNYTNENKQILLKTYSTPIIASKLERI